jgi:hypothetical protein
MGVLADSMRELIASMKANEERERELLTNDLQSIINNLDRVSQGLTQITDEMETWEEIEIEE